MCLYWNLNLNSERFMNSTVIILNERSTDQNLRMLETVLSGFPGLQLSIIFQRTARYRL